MFHEINMKKLFNKNRKAFTPIELLFVFLVLGLLILISIIFLNSSRLKARDAKRLVDIRRIQTSLEFYNLEYDSYPITKKSIVIGKNPYNKVCDEKSGSIVSLQTQCSKEFMSLIPTDPISSKAYIYKADKNGFTIIFKTEGDTVLGRAGTYFAHSNSVDKDPALK